MSDAAQGRRFVTYDETGEEREVVGYCHVCRVHPDDEVMLVSPQGIAHQAEQDVADIVFGSPCPPCSTEKPCSCGRQDGSGYCACSCGRCLWPYPLPDDEPLDA